MGRDRPQRGPASPPAWSPPCTTTQGRVTLPGFYDQVRAADRRPSRRRSTPSRSTRRRSGPQAGGVAYLEGEAGYSALERIGVRPTAEVVGLHGGYGGPGIKTIVPATAGFKVAFRLVPDQRPDEIDAAFRAWLAERVPAGVAVDRHPRGRRSPPPSRPSTTRPWAPWRRAIERVWGQPPLYTREGGSGPEEALGPGARRRRCCSSASACPTTASTPPTSGW